MKYFFPILLFVLIYNQTIGQNSLDNFSWIIDNWSTGKGKMVYYENWKANGDKELIGHGFMVVKGDTVFSENISIKLETDGIYYYAAVSNQNEGKAIPFKLVSSSSYEILFENKEHDFPQRIIYTKKSNLKMIVVVEGIQKDKERKETFRLKRIRC
ncbi:MAG: hypothetical protein JKY33_00665 [Bacteroidia bacterium]|nr:hypothetical protein [Bacteroidia bacterium]